MNRLNLASFIIYAALVGLTAGCGGASGEVGGASASAPANNAATDSRGAETARTQANTDGANVDAANAAGANVPAAEAAGANGVTANPPPKKGVSGAQTAKMPEPQIGSGGQDLFLFTKVRGAIETDAELKGSGIILDARNGVVVLSGAVADEARRARAEQLARGVEGVKSVKNELRISKSGAPR